MNEDHLRRFRDAVSPERQRISLAEAALMVAQDAYPDLDIQAQMGDIERLTDLLACAEIDEGTKVGLEIVMPASSIGNAGKLYAGVHPHVEQIGN